MAGFATDGFILLVALACAALLLWPPVARAIGWRATVTPLASIIGSGFLILGPILAASFGMWAPVVMAGLCGVAYAFGAAIRFNIATGEARTETRSGLMIEEASSVVLAFAYVVSVAYYLNLFGAFAVSLTPYPGPMPATIVTTVIYVVIMIVGMHWGFEALERLEQFSVSIKLAIIAGLLAGLAVAFAGDATTGGLILNPTTLTGWAAVTMMFGLIVTVQGFETSRYLGETYAPDMRIRSMRWAQWLSSAIYCVYIVLLAYLFEADQLEISETAIIDLMGVVSPILPILLVAAALSAQFSAAVADTGGSGGLMAETTRGRVTVAQGYAVVGGIGLLLTWTLDVFQIVAYASRAFALYYALQSALAALCQWREGRKGRAVFCATLATFGVIIVAFGRAVEGA